MVRASRFFAFLLLVSFLFSCSPTAQESLPSAATATAQPSPTAEPLEPLSMVDALAARAAKEGWSESQSLVLGLRFLTRDISVQEAFGHSQLVNGEGTGLIRAAQIYLQDSSNVVDRSELERLLSILIPSRDTLDKFSQPAVSMRRVPGMAARAARPAGNPEECQALWRTGFDAPIPLVCLEYDQFTDGERVYRVYYPAYWPESDPRRGMLQPAFNALEESVRLYNTYGPEPVMSTEIVFTDLDIAIPDPDTDGILRDPDVYAAALFPVGPGGTDVPVPGESSCRVGVFPAALDEEGTLRQTLAHELFHCYQYTNLRLEEYAARQAGTNWWVEGSAEFFGSVVYPEIDNEFQYLGRFTRRLPGHSLLSLDYDAYPFFLYLARQAGLGPEGVIALLRQMPEEAGGMIAEQQILAAYPGILEAFHRFGQGFVDRRLEDYSGRPLPITPNEGALAAFALGEGEGFFPSQPFEFKVYRLNFADQAHFSLTPNIAGEGKLSLRAASAPGAWGLIPGTLNTACGEREFVLLVTSAIPPGAEPIALILSTVGEQVEEGVACEECVLGTWQLDNGSYLAHMGELWPLTVASMPSFGLSTGGVEVHPTEVFGVMEITFKQDGTVNGLQAGWGIAGQGTVEGKTIEVSTFYNGAGQATWRIETDGDAARRFLFFDEGTFDIQMSMTFIGQTIAPRSTDGSNDPIFLSSPQPFLCSETTLTYNAEDPLGPMLFTRTTPPPG